jgi:hypothetical protein
MKIIGLEILIAIIICYFIFFVATILKKDNNIVLQGCEETEWMSNIPCPFCGEMMTQYIECQHGYRIRGTKHDCQEWKEWVTDIKTETFIPAKIGGGQ